MNTFAFEYLMELPVLSRGEVSRGKFPRPGHGKRPGKMLLMVDSFIQDACWTLSRERL